VFTTALFNVSSPTENRFRFPVICVVILAQGLTEIPVHWASRAHSSGAKKAEREFDHTWQYTAEVQNEWIYFSTPSNVFMALCLTTRRDVFMVTSSGCEYIIWSWKAKSYFEGWSVFRVGPGMTETVKVSSLAGSSQKSILGPSELCSIVRGDGLCSVPYCKRGLY
jgi:hypothetical protein